MKKLVIVLGVLLGVLGMILVGVGVHMRETGAMAVSIIGGADGPTSVFLAGKIGNDFSNAMMIVGAILVAIVAIVVVLKRKK